MLKSQTKIFLLLLCIGLIILGIVGSKYYIDINFYKSMEAQFRRDINETLNRGDNLVLCRVSNRRIVQHRENQFWLGSFVDFEVILSVNDDFICGTILRSFSNSDESYRESVESVLRPSDKDTLYFVRTDSVTAMKKIIPFDVLSEAESYNYCNIYLTEWVLPIFSCSYGSPEYELAIKIFDEYRKQFTVKDENQYGLKEKSNCCSDTDKNKVCIKATESHA